MLLHGMVAVLLVTGVEQTTSPASTPEPVNLSTSSSSNDAPPAQGLTPFRFQLDARIGFGVLGVTISGEPLVIGMSLPVALSAGLSLTKALVAFGEISDSHTLLFNAGASNGIGALDLYGAGLGMKYYLTPKYFLFGAASIARLQFQGGGDTSELSHWGVLARVSAGREWPVSATWSMGVAGEYQLGSMQSGGLASGALALPEIRYRPSGLSALVLASFHQAASHGSEDGAGRPPTSTSTGTGLTPFGLYMDAQFGLGALWPRVGHGYWITGASVPLALAAGMNLTRSLAAFGELSDVHMFGPSANVGDNHLFSLDLSGVGLGLKLYLTPRAFFLSGSASLAHLHYEGFTDTSFNLSETSHWGVLGRIAAGREWPISPSWSLGAAGELQLGTMKTSATFDNNNYGSDSFTVKGLSVLGIAVFSPPAQREPAGPEAPGPVRPAGFHAHDGFYANVSLGPGWIRMNNRQQDQLYAAPDYEYSGRGTRLSLSLGYAFADSFVVFVEGSELQVHDPTTAFDISTLAWYGVGPGLRYYLMPANVFLSASIVMSQVVMENSEPDDDIYGYHRTTRWGATGQLSLGKEWWVLGDLGVGVAAEFGFGKMAGNDDWLTYTAKTFSLLASVSYN